MCSEFSPYRIAHRVVGLRSTLMLAAAIGLVAMHDPAPARDTVQSAANADGQRPNAEPSPRFTPEDVIRIQIGALSAEGDVRTRIENCYRFASPANRSYTGPLARFAGMVQSPSYAALLNAKHFLVGRASQDNGEARLLLTVVDGNGELSVFRCFLSKQTNVEFAGCWMTDAVIPVGIANPLDQLRTPPSPPSI